VAGVAEAFELLPPQPIAIAPVNIEKSASIEIQRLRLCEIPHVNKNARAVAPLPIPNRFPPVVLKREAVVAAAVLTVSTLVPEAADERARLVGAMVHVGRFCAPEGEVVSEQDRFRVPW
jgi:hypothetical protein